MRKRNARRCMGALPAVAADRENEGEPGEPDRLHALSKLAQLQEGQS